MRNRIVINPEICHWPMLSMTRGEAPSSDLKSFNHVKEFLEVCYLNAPNPFTTLLSWGIFPFFFFFFPCSFLFSDNRFMTECRQIPGRAMDFFFVYLILFHTHLFLFFPAFYDFIFFFFFFVLFDVGEKEFSQFLGFVSHRIHTKDSYLH